MDPRADRLIRYAGAFAPDVVASASGSFVETIDGRRILDFTAGQICATIGHNHPRVVAAIEEAGRTVLHLNAWTLSEPVLALEERCNDRGFMHATSHISDPMPAAAALAVLDVVEEERLADAARVKGEYL